MRIGINALFLRNQGSFGVKTYFDNIVKRWYLDSSSDCEFVLFCSSLPEWWNGDRENFSLFHLPIAKNLPIRIFSEQFILPFLVKTRKIDVLFHPSYVSSLLSDIPQIVTIHDAYAWICPKEAGFFRAFYWQLFIPPSLKKSNKVIAVSHNTAYDIRRFCNFNDNKIEVIPESGSHLSEITADNKILDKLNLKSKSFFLCVGFYAPIKNTRRILEAYQIYTKQSSIDQPKNLVLVGGASSPWSKKTLEIAQQIPGVINAGRVSEAELVALYAQSAGLIFTTLYEGFGIPILEAQGLGCPVITSSVSSMPEVVGSGGLVVDPTSIHDIAKAMLEIEDPDVVEHLLRVGFQNQNFYSWDSSSQATLNVLLNSQDV
jgi:glycosyltransferase involved in cell wall biosynthesis